MTNAIANANPSGLASTPKAERRSVPRYPIELQLRYRLMNNGRTVGFGKTINVSSRGVLFEADDQPSEKGKIEVCLSWPMRLEGVCRLQLIMRGPVVRRGAGTIAMRAHFYEFRTVGRSVKWG